MTEVKLVSYSRATEEFEEEGLTDLQELIAFCAKVSNPQAQINNDTSERLIKYLIKHQHWSPLEMVNAVLEINTTRDIAHQIVRHRSFAFQEFSQRYANPEEMGEQFVTRECRLQDTKNRQNSLETSDEELAKKWEQKQRKLIDLAKETYIWANSYEEAEDIFCRGGGDTDEVDCNGGDWECILNADNFEEDND